MPSMTSNLLALTAILALATLPSTVTAAGAKPKKHNLRKKQRQLRRGQVNHLNNVNKKQQKAEGLEEDVAFWTNMVRRTQDMSVPVTPAPVPVPTPGVPTTPAPTGGGGGTSPAPNGVITPPPVPVVGGVCAVGESCTAVGDTCSDGTTEECCDSVFDSFVCDCIENDAGALVYQCQFTDACLGAPETCPTNGPGPTPTPPPASGFNCPDPSFVGCTAVDPENPTDECPTVGEPCPGSTAGEFCCLDACPRNYCTAKQAPSSSTQTAVQFFAAPIDMDEVKAGVKDTTPNSL